MQSIKRELLYIRNLFLILLIIVGALISLLMILTVPHNILVWLAGGLEHPYDVSLFFFFWPVSLVGAVITLCFDNVVVRKNSGGLWVIPGPFTYTFLMFFFLPIIFNGVSKLCGFIGLEEMSNLFFDLRWKARALLFFGSFGILIIIGTLFFLLDRYKLSRTQVRVA